MYDLILMGMDASKEFCSKMMSECNKGDRYIENQLLLHFCIYLFVRWVLTIFTMSLSVAVLRVKEWRVLTLSCEYLLMTIDTDEKTNPPEMAEMLRLDGSVGRALEYQSKGGGFKSHCSRSIRTSTTRLCLTLYL